MLNLLAKILLAATSLSPILGAAAVRDVGRGEPLKAWIWYVAAAVFLILLCHIMLHAMACRAQQFGFLVERVKRQDHAIVGFLFAYMLPLLLSDAGGVVGGWWTSIYAIVVLLWALIHARAFHFNPVMARLGYHFYSVTDTRGYETLLIAKTAGLKSGTPLTVVKLAEGVVLLSDKENGSCSTASISPR